MSFPGAAPLCETEDVLAGATPSLGLVHSPRRRRPRSPALQCGVLPGAPGGLQREEKPAPRPPPAHGPGWRRGCEPVKRRGSGLRTQASGVHISSPPTACSRARKTSAGGAIFPHSCPLGLGEPNLRFHSGSRDHQTLGPPSWELGVTCFRQSNEPILLLTQSGALVLNDLANQVWEPELFSQSAVSPLHFPAS